MNRDFVEMLFELSAAGVEFLVGVHALAAHGVPRATGDLARSRRPRTRAGRETGGPLTI